MARSVEAAAQVSGEGASVSAGGAATAIGAPRPRRRRLGGSPWTKVVFLLPALVVLAGLVLYPIVFSVVRSLFDASGAHFVGAGNYVRMFTDSATFTAIKNNVIWVAVAPTVVTALGLVFAVLMERIRWATAFKLLIFMPMAISFLASGVIFRLVYDQDPSKGVANAIIVSVHDIFAKSSPYAGARPRDDTTLAPKDGGFASVRTYAPGQPAALGLVGLPPAQVPKDAAQAAPSTASRGLSGTVWLDFARGGGGTAGVIDQGEKGLPGVTVRAVRDGRTVAETETDAQGRFSFPDLTSGRYTLALPHENFAQPFRGLTWLGSTLVTPAIIAAYVWIHAGFAMVIIAAGLASIPRDVQEAARIDGATEWQVFRRVTVPLLSPVLLVVFVTLVINVLKIFDLVYIIAPGSTQGAANVLALQMWRVSFGGGDDHGLGSAIGVFLFLLVLPAMIFNIRRFRREQR